jgi:NAD(P)H-flavin reductase
MRVALTRIIQQYIPWAGAVGLTLDASEIGRLSPGQCLLYSPVAADRAVLPHPCIPSAQHDREKTLDVLVPAYHFERHGFGTGGDRCLRVIGPVGRPFTVDPKTRRALLVDGGSLQAPLLLLVHRLVELGVEITYLAVRRDGAHPVPSSVFPPEIEYHIVEDSRLGGAEPALAKSLDSFVPWADAMYVAVGQEHVQAIVNVLRRRLLRLRKGYAQGLVMPGLLPCGVGACDLCTIATRDGYRRLCRDGLVFDLLSLI